MSAEKRLRSQFAFRKNRSTKVAVLEQKEYILKGFEGKNICLGVLVTAQNLSTI